MSSRGNRKRKMNWDLNRDPPTEEDSNNSNNNVRGRNQEGPSRQQQQPQAPIVDVDAIDDDVVECSPRSFAQSKSIADERRRVRTSLTIIQLDSEDGTREDPQNQTTINGNANNENAKTPEPPKEPEPIKEPVFNCPICMAPLVEETSTRCGHIFCKSCIRTAVSTQSKCPTCRKKVTRNSLIRVFLPAAS